MIGFGAAGPVTRTPVIFIHGNNDTPFPTACNPYGASRIGAVLRRYGYSTERALGHRLPGRPVRPGATRRDRSGIAHTDAANVPDLRRFVHAVLAFTGARAGRHRRAQPRRHARARMDAAGPRHALGAALRGDRRPEPRHHRLLADRGELLAGGRRRRLHARAAPVCQSNRFAEHAVSETAQPRQARRRGRRVPGDPQRRHQLRLLPEQDGVLAPVPAEDYSGAAHDFSQSATLRGAEQMDLIGQGAYDPILGTAHLGILNSPETWELTLDFLTDRSSRRHP